VTPDGTGIVTGTSDGTVRISDATPSLEPVQLTKHTHKIVSAAITPDQNRIVTSDDSTTRIWDAKTGAQLIGEWANEVVVASDGAVIITRSNEGIARVRPVETRHRVIDLKGNSASAITAASATADGTRIITGSADGTVHIWDAKTGEELAPQLKGPQTSITAIAVTADATRIVTGSSDWIARIWNVKTPHEPTSLKGHSNWIRSVAVTRDGTRIVTGSDDRTARVWDARTGKELGEPLVGHSGSVTAVAVTSDGTQIVTGSNDRTVRIWDANTRVELAQLRDEKHAFSTVAVTADGRVVTGSSDGTVRIWKRLATGQALVDEAKATLRRCLSPSQRKFFTLPQIPPRWCVTKEKWPYDAVSLAKASLERLQIACSGQA
jgi:WD40 repeat protein